MHPVLLRMAWADQLGYGGHELVIGSYGLCLALALVLGSGLALARTTQAGLDVGATIASLAAAIGCGFGGAVLLFAAVSCLRGLPLMAAVTQPGIVFYGGALGALVGFLLAARLLALPAPRALDAITPVLPLAHALGRVGCFLGGCCYGAPWHGALAVTYSDPLAPGAHPALPRHPWPLYEATALLVLSLVLFRLPTHRFRMEGTRFATYVVGYALVRFSLEPLRGDLARGLVFGGALSISQLCAALALSVTLAALAFARTRARCT